MATRRFGWRLAWVALVLAAASGSSRCIARQQSPRPAGLSPSLPQVIYNGSRGEKRIAMTFDACSSIHMSKVDKQVVKILVDDHVPATLFLGGKWVRDQPREARYLASIPFFEIGNHAYHHPHLTRMSVKAMRHELLAAQHEIEKVTGVTPHYFRAPYGQYNRALVETAASLGLTTIQFDLASGDPDRHFTRDILSRWVIRKARAGSIVVMHINTHGWHTAEALPIIIKALRARGYRFVTISQLLKESFPAPGMVLAGDTRHAHGRHKAASQVH